MSCNKRIGVEKKKVNIFIRPEGGKLSEMSKKGIVYAKEVPMIKVKKVEEKNGKGTPLQAVIQYWTKDGIIVAEGRANQFDEPEMKDTAS